MFVGAERRQDRRGWLDGCDVSCRRGQCCHGFVQRFAQGHGLILAYGNELNFVPGLKLAQLPEIRADDGYRADKTAQTGAIGPQNNRHIAGEVHAAHSVGVVVDIGRVHASLGAIAAGPLRFRANQPYAGAAGVVVDLPVAGKEGVDVLVGKVVRRAVGPIGDVQFPGLADGWFQFGRQGGRAGWLGIRQGQHITGT